MQARSVGGGFAQNINRIINGGMEIDQEHSGAAQTITAAAALAYTVDQWYAYCTGANVTGQQVAGSGKVRKRYQFTGAASVTKIGFAQRMEAANCFDLNGGVATLAVDLANSLLTTVTWTAWYANSADTFGTLAAPTRTQIATGTFTINSTVSRYSAQITIPAAATTGIEIEFSVGGQTSGTWTIGSVKLESGTTATPFVSSLSELALCQRYYVQDSTSVLAGVYSAAAFATTNTISFPVTMRSAPTVVIVSVGSIVGIVYTSTNSNMITTKGFTNIFNTTSAGNTTGSLTLQWTASARL